MAAIRRFTDLRKADVNFAGGKGANLGELTRAGLPVPPGFVIGAPAYMAFCDAGGLRGRIAAYLEHVDVDDTAALAQTAAEVRDMIMAEPLPEWLEHDIRDAYEELRAGDSMLAVAVRSSATAEDTESASFAPPRSGSSSGIAIHRSEGIASTSPPACQRQRDGACS